MDRTGTLERNTKETRVLAEINLDGRGSAECTTGIGFFNHMLTLFAVHGRMDLKVAAKGDLEDVGIVLGKVLGMALGEKKDIRRYGTAFVPMDESLAMVSLDISGRPYLSMEFPSLAPMVGDFDTQLLEEFFRALSVHSGITLHIRVLYGKNTHHMIEAAFKALGRALHEAAGREAQWGGVPSTKGLLD